MLDGRLRPLIDPPLRWCARRLVRLGADANTITLIGFLAGLAAVVALAYQAYGVALVLFMLNRLADGFDGAVARAAQSASEEQSAGTDFGGYLDIVCDFIIYSAMPFGFAVGHPDQAVAATFLVFSFMGTGSTFLTFAIFAQKRGLSTDHQGRKVLYYLGGLTEGTETIVTMVGICLFPDAFALIAWSYGALCWITTVTRIMAAREAFQ
jgi:phosphatidylglycerophosphate synthase